MKYQELIGKEVSMSGWHYNNSGSIAGVIESIEPSKYQPGKFTITTENRKYAHNMLSFTCSPVVLDTLLRGEKFESNRLLNTGTNASLAYSTTK